MPRENNSKKETIDVVFVLFDIGLTLENSAVFQSQVGDQIIALQSLGFTVGLLALYKDEQKLNTVIGNKLKENGTILEFVQEKCFTKNFLAMTTVLRKWKQRNLIRFCYVRGLWGPLLIKMASPFSSIPYIYDVRGDLADELAAVNSKKSRKNIYLALEKWGIRNAYKVTAVTNMLATNIAKKFSITNVSVIPCCINTADFTVAENIREGKRKQMGFDASDIVLVYSGGLSHYQQVPKMLELWTKFIPYSGVKFLLLTNDDPHSHPVTVNSISSFGNKMIHKSLPRNEIPATLAAGDIAFILRESRALNGAASPVKFPEYLSAGLAIVASPGIGDMSNYVLEHNIGVLIDVNDLAAGKKQVEDMITRIRTDGQENIRHSAKRLSETVYDWSYYKDTYSGLYEKEL